MSPLHFTIARGGHSSHRPRRAVAEMARACVRFLKREFILPGAIHLTGRTSRLVNLRGARLRAFHANSVGRMRFNRRFNESALTSVRLFTPREPRQVDIQINADERRRGVKAK